MCIDWKRPESGRKKTSWEGESVYMIWSDSRRTDSRWERIIYIKRRRKRHFYLSYQLYLYAWYFTFVLIFNPSNIFRHGHQVHCKDNKIEAAAAAKSLQSCPTLCDPIDSSPPGSPVPGILQARTLEWVAISFSNAWKWKVRVKLLSRVRLLATPWTATYQAPPSMGFSRQEYWSGVPLPSPT